MEHNDLQSMIRNAQRCVGGENGEEMLQKAVYRLCHVRGVDLEEAAALAIEQGLTWQDVLWINS